MIALIVAAVVVYLGIGVIYAYVIDASGWIEFPLVTVFWFPIVAFEVFIDIITSIDW